MMTEDEFYEWFAQTDLNHYANDIFEWYQKSHKYDALVEYGVDNWPDYGVAMQSLESEDDNDN